MDILRQTSSTREDLGLLAVMEALEDREQVTQREIARQTGLNLKKVNFCLHKLLEKGHIKFQRVRQNPDKRAYLYILTPSGMKAKSQLTYRFVKFTLDFYSRLEQKLGDSLRQIADAGVKHLLLYGASDVARILLDMTDGRPVAICGIADDSAQGEGFYGIQVISSKRITEVAWDGILITDVENVDAAAKQLATLGVAEHHIWRL